MNRRPGAFDPRILDRLGPGGRPEVNPYRETHRHFGPELVPADRFPEWAGRFAEHFGRDAPLHVELGTGSGDWLVAMARLHPGWNWLGVEIRYKRCTQTARRIRAAELPHARVARFSWFGLDGVFGEGELAGLHINHPDPWPSEKDRKHRVIEPGFAALVARWLRPGAEWRLKTDFAPHAEAMLTAIAGLPFELIGRSGDIRAEGAPWPDEVVTPYQARFDADGVPVHGVRVRRR